MTMGEAPFRAALDSQVSSHLVSDRSRVQPCESSTFEQPNGKASPTCWECTTCRRRYVDSESPSLFITPPPATECIHIQTDEAWTHAHGTFVDLSLIRGATCDYVRMSHAVSELDFRKPVAKPEDAVAAKNMTGKGQLQIWACDTPLMKVAGEHGRVSRQNEALDTACDHDDAEQDEFWKARCEDIDCIYAGEHYRHQCALAESDEEPKPMEPAPRRFLRFGRSVPWRGR